MLTDFISAALVTLLVTLDPVALAPIFVSLTRGMNAAERRRVSTRASLIAFGILAFRISGGLLLFWIAFEMVFERRNERKQHTADIAITEDHIRNVAAFPLAIPLMAGPGAITAVILLAGRADGNVVALSALIGLIALGVLSCFLVFAAADRVSRWLGVTGNVVLTRLLGVILAGLAVQFIINGIEALLRPAAL
jgi:multiple antibiotic resistance protein